MSVQYPKQFMSITELTETGLSREYLKQLARASGAPIVKTMKGGKIYFITAELNDFMKEITNRERKRGRRRC
jgi:molybdenum-dependent DNA-binding transcriptional regulator ModE